MTIFVEPGPEPDQVPELKQLLNHREDYEYVQQLLKIVEQGPRQWVEQP